MKVTIQEGVETPSYSPEELLQALRQIIRYKQEPPTIDEALEDDYFLGKIFNNGKSVYPFWRDHLRELYPNNILTSANIVTITGGIGLGKTTFTQIGILYDLIKFSLMENPEEFFDLMALQGYYFKMFNLFKWKAEDFTNVLNGVVFGGEWGDQNYDEKRSPFFAEELSDKSSNIHRINIDPAGRMADMISNDLFSASLSELNFMNYDKGIKLIDEVINRTFSRFEKGKKLFNHIFLDSSATDTESPIDYFKRTSAFSSITKHIQAPIWEAKRGLGIYDERTFRVYSGDATKQPFIFEEGQGEEGLDEDRILNVPINLRDQFKSDLILALQDIAGVSVHSSASFMVNFPAVDKCLNLPVNYNEIITLDFYEDHDILWTYLEEEIMKLPKEKTLYVRGDAGVSNDIFGLAIGYADHLKEVKDRHGKKLLKEIVINVPIVIGLSRKPGQETAINKVRDFILELDQHRRIKRFSTDQYQSTQLRQEIEQQKIDVELLSVDRTDTAYMMFKRHIYRGLVNLPASETLSYELKNLYRNEKGKIDHQAFSTKDMSDAVAGVIQMILDDGPEEALAPVVREEDKQKIFDTLWSGALDNNNLIKTDSANQAKENILKSMGF